MVSPEFMQALSAQIGEIADRFGRHPHHLFGNPVRLSLIDITGGADG